MISKLQQWGPLGEEDQAALLDLPHKVVGLKPHAYIVREGERPSHVSLMLSGFSVRHKATGGGARQIFSIHMKGDLADLQNAFLGMADHSLQALTAVEIAQIPAEAMMKVAFDRPAVGKALWKDGLVDAAIFREWILNVGRRDARTRMAHMLCEFAFRLEAVGLGERCSYELPMTQEQLADALGLTSVHVNRTLMSLGEDGLISRTKKTVRIEDWARLAAAGDFESGYLHVARKVEPSAHLA